LQAGNSVKKLAEKWLCCWTLTWDISSLNGDLMSLGVNDEKIISEYSQTDALRRS
jgi:hypothetical protein